MPKISELPATNFPSLDSDFPTSRDGETVKVTGRQLRNLMLFAANEIAYKLDVSVEQALTELANTKANTSDVTTQVNGLQTNIDNLTVSIPIALATKINKAGQKDLGGFSGTPQGFTGILNLDSQVTGNWVVFTNNSTVASPIIKAPVGDGGDSFFIVIQNSAGASPITFTGFSVPIDGDVYTTGEGQTFVLSVARLNWVVIGTLKKVT